MSYKKTELDELSVFIIKKMIFSTFTQLVAFGLELSFDTKILNVGSNKTNGKTSGHHYFIIGLMEDQSSIQHGGTESVDLSIITSFESSV